MTENTFQTLYKQRHFLESAFRARGDKASFSERWIISIIVPILSLNVLIFLVQRSDEFPFNTWLIAICGILGGGLFITALYRAVMNSNRLSSLHALGFILTAYAINSAGFVRLSACFYVLATVLIFCVCLKYAKTFELKSSEAMMFSFIAGYSAIFINWIAEAEKFTAGHILLYCCLSMCLIIGFRAYKNISSLLLLIIIGGIVFLSSIVTVVSADEIVGAWWLPYLFYVIIALTYEFVFLHKQRLASYKVSDLRVFLNQSFHFFVFSLFFLLLHLLESDFDAPEPSEIILPASILFIGMQIIFSKLGNIAYGMVRLLICFSVLDLALLSVFIDAEPTMFWEIIKKFPKAEQFHFVIILAALGISHLIKWRVSTRYKSSFGFSFLQFWSVIVISFCYLIFFSGITGYDFRFSLPTDLTQMSSKDISIIPSFTWMTFLSVLVFVASKFYNPQNFTQSTPWWMGVLNNRTAVTIIRLHRDVVKWVQKEKIISPLLIASQFFQSILKFLKGSKSNLSSSDIVMLLVLGFLVLVLKHNADWIALKLTFEEIKTGTNAENIAHFGNLLTLITTGLIVGSIGIFSDLLFYRYISISAFFLIMYYAFAASFRENMPYDVEMYFWLGASFLGAFLGALYWLIMTLRVGKPLPKQ